MKKEALNIAIVGGGVAGISAAHYLSQNHHVTLFEKNSRLGGHTNTIHFDDDGKKAVDTGFIVYNQRNYPHFCKLLEDWSVPTQESNMSFAFNRGDKFYYSGTGLKGLFAQKKNLVSLSYYKFLKGILDFGQKAKEHLNKPNLISEWTLEDAFRNWSVSDSVIQDYIIPMAAAIWSGSFSQMKQFPALLFFKFFDNHGLLTFKDRPKWRTIQGGSYEYVKAFLKQFQGSVELNAQIEKIKRHDNKVQVFNHGESFEFDHVVLAVHANQVLPLLDKPSPEESYFFSKWSYSKNKTLLHSDNQILPKNKSAWASWNYHQCDHNSPVAVTYDMNRLQNIQSTKDFLVTLNPNQAIDDSKIIFKTIYEHPEYDFESFQTQEEIYNLSGTQNTWFCGSYLGYGFHEDAVRSSFEMASKLEASC